MAIAAVLAANAYPQSSVWVVDVDGGPGADFTDLQAAVTAVADGDLLLVRSGQYRGFTLDSKSLTIVADEDADVVVQPPVEISGIGVDQSVLLRGIDVVPPPTPPAGDAPALRLESNAGPVWIEEASLRGGLDAASEAVAIDDCASATLTRCEVLGLNVGSAGIRGGIEGDVHLFDSTVTGGPGGPGIGVLGQAVSVAGCVVRGGDGLDGQPCDGTDGGAGYLHDGGAPAVISLLDSSVTGGAGGLGAAGCSDGEAGPDLVTGPLGLVVPLPGDARSIVPKSPVTEGHTLLKDIIGQPGDIVFTVFTEAQAPGLFLPLFLNVLLLEPPFFLEFGAVLGSTGMYTTEDVVVIGPTLESATLYLQAVALDTGGVWHLSNPSAIVILDDSF